MSAAVTTAISDLRFVGSSVSGGSNSNKMMKTMMMRLLLCISIVVIAMMALVDGTDTTTSLRLKKRQLTSKATSSTTSERSHSSSSLQQLLHEKRQRQQERISNNQVLSSNRMINKSSSSRSSRRKEEEEEDAEKEQNNNNGTTNNEVENNNNVMNGNKKEEEKVALDNTDSKEEEEENNLDGNTSSDTNNKQEEVEEKDEEIEQEDGQQEEVKQEDDEEVVKQEDEEEEVTNTKDEDSTPNNNEQEEEVEDVIGSGGSDSASDNDLVDGGDNDKVDNTGDEASEENDGDGSDEDVVMMPTDQPTASPNTPEEEDETVEEEELLPTPSPNDVDNEDELLPTPSSPNDTTEDEELLPTPTPNSDVLNNEEFPSSNPIMFETSIIDDENSTTLLPTPSPIIGMITTTDFPTLFRNIPIGDVNMTNEPTAFMIDDITNTTTFDICHVCDNNDNAIIQNPDQLIFGTRYGLSTLLVSCSSIYFNGLDGILTAEQCNIISNDNDFYNDCGCMNDDTTVNPTPSITAADTSVDDYDTRTSFPTPSSSSSGSSGSSSNSSFGVVCHLCNGDPTGTIQEPDKVISFELFGQIYYETCSTIKRILKNSIFNETECNDFISNDDIYTTCGCTPGGSGDDEYLWDDDANTGTDICYVCGPDAYTRNFSTIVDVSYLNIGVDEAPCSIVERLGYDGVLTPEECDQVSSDKNFYNECECTNITYTDDTYNDDALEPTTCFACYGSPEFVVTNGDVVIDVSWPGLPVDSVTCSIIYSAGLLGILTREQCSSIQSNADFYEDCGCEYNGNGTAYPTSSNSNDAEPSVVCHICDGDSTAIILYPNYLVSVDISYFPDGYVTTCKDLKRKGKQEYFYESECDIIKSDTDIYTTCGCVTVGNGDDEYLWDDDTANNFETCYVCSNEATMNVFNPNFEFDLSTLDMSLGMASCKEIYKAGLNVLFTKEQCETISNDNNFFNDCECRYDADLDPAVTCYMCDGDMAASLEFPKSDVSLSFIGLPNDSATCAEVKEAGELGLFIKSECDAVKADEQISQTCGCTPGPGTCHVCGKPDLFISNLFMEVNLSESDFPISSASCSSLYEIGLLGLMTTAQCDWIMSNNDYFTDCGCTDSPLVICYMCDGDMTATLEFPQSNVNLSFAGLPNESATCAQVKDAGENGFLTKSQCDALNADEEISETCGCPDSSPVPKPIQVPVVRPSPIVKQPIKAPSIIRPPVRRPSTIIRPPPIFNQSPVAKRPIPDKPFFDLVLKPRSRLTPMPIVKKPIVTKPISSKPTMTITPSTVPSDMPSDVPTMMDTMTDTMTDT